MGAAAQDTCEDDLEYKEVVHVGKKTHVVFPQSYPSHLLNPRVPHLLH